MQALCLKRDSARIANRSHVGSSGVRIGQEIALHVRRPASSAKETVGASVCPAIEHDAAMDAAVIGLPAGTDRVVGQGVARLSASIGSRARDRAAVPAAGVDRGRRVHLLRAGGLQHAAGGGRLPSGAAGADAGRDHVRPHLSSRGEPVHAGEPAGGVPTGAACNENSAQRSLVSNQRRPGRC